MRGFMRLRSLSCLNIYIPRILCIGIWNRKIFSLMCREISSWQILDLLKLLSRELILFVGLQSIWLPRFFFKKDTGNPLIGGVWEYLYMKWLWGLIRFLMMSLWLFTKIFSKEKWNSLQPSPKMPKVSLNIFWWPTSPKDTEISNEEWRILKVIDGLKISSGVNLWICSISLRTFQESRTRETLQTTQTTLILQIYLKH